MPPAFENPLVFCVLCAIGLRFGVSGMVTMRVMVRMIVLMRFSVRVRVLLVCVLRPGPLCQRWLWAHALPGITDPDA